MPEKKISPYGSWKSPISTEMIVSESVGLGDMEIDGTDIYWLETRPSEGGRYVVVRKTSDGLISDVIQVDSVQGPLYMSTEVDHI